MNSHLGYLTESNQVFLGSYERELLSVLTGIPVAETIPLPLARQLLEQAKQGAAELSMPVLRGTAEALLSQLESELPPEAPVPAAALH